ncbi:MAG: oligopeptide ABC transporter ATP-binding protein [Clostridiales bacterium]|nr:MAG: oligopeptide ABC transporter ATP-binding protein [Clostridiales bacterium]
MDEKREVLLSVRNLQQYFKMGRKINKAVDGISFDIYKGEVFGLVGESGCGKTTTGRSIIRLYDITGGSVYFKGHRICAGINTYKEAIAAARRDCERRIAELGKNADPAGIAALRSERDSFIRRQQEEIKLARYDQKYCNKQYSKNEVERVKAGYEAKLAAVSGSEREALSQKMEHEIMLARSDRITNKIQMIFQDPIASLDPRMTVREIIAEGLIIRGVHDRKYIDEQVYRVLDLVGLVPEHAGRYPHEFSGGQRQRIGIARAIILRPDLIIADEPISALDVSIQAQVINLLNELRNSLGLTILFIAHDLSVVKYFSDRIAVMYFGKIVELADSDELFRHPLHPYTKSLLSAIPLPDPHSEKRRQRLIYNPIAEHDYSVDGPSLREISPGHFVSCNDAEYAAYRKVIENG